MGCAIQEPWSDTGGRSSTERRRRHLGTASLARSNTSTAATSSRCANRSRAVARMFGGQSLPLPRLLACDICPIQVRRTWAQLDLPIRTWGGRRPGAGRPPSSGRPRAPHRRRERHQRHCPAHVTLRAASGLPSLRDTATFAALRRAFGASLAPGFRILHFSVQRDHVHLLVEGDDAGRFSRRIQGLSIRLAKAVNRALGRRGRVWGDRYHTRALRTPREVRHALVYVLHNARKHLRAVRGLDPCSSAGWFDGWVGKSAPWKMPAPVAPARTWLARVGWRRLGLIHVEEAPVGARPPRRR